MLALQRRQSPLQNSPYCLVSEFEGEQPEGEESRPNPTLGNRRCPLPFSQTSEHTIIFLGTSSRSEAVREMAQSQPQTPQKMIKDVCRLCEDPFIVI